MCLIYEKEYILLLISVVKEMATHYCILAWEIPWTEEPSGLQSMELQSIRHDFGAEHACTDLSGVTVKNECKDVRERGFQKTETCSQ